MGNIIWGKDYFQKSTGRIREWKPLLFHNVVLYYEIHFNHNWSNAQPWCKKEMRTDISRHMGEAVSRALGSWYGAIEMSLLSSIYEMEAEHWGEGPSPSLHLIWKYIQICANIFCTVTCPYFLFVFWWGFFYFLKETRVVKKAPAVRTLLRFSSTESHDGGILWAEPHSYTKIKLN